MKRYRITLLAVCLVLGWLGYHDLKLFFNNPEPLPVNLAEIETGGAPREWLQIDGGYLDLEQAINPTGELESLESGPFFVPVVGRSGSGEIRVVVETRRQEVIDLLKSFVLDFDSVEARQAFLEKNRERFRPQVSITGMTASWLTSTANRDKLLQLAKEQNMPVSADVIFISEGKEPGKFRGFFFSVVAILGIVKFISMTAKKESGLAVEIPSDDE